MECEFNQSSQSYLLRKLQKEKMANPSKHESMTNTKVASKSKRDGCVNFPGKRFLFQEKLSAKSYLCKQNFFDLKKK